MSNSSAGVIYLSNHLSGAGNVPELTVFKRLTRYKLLIIIIHGACFKFQVLLDGVAKALVSDPVC